MLSVLCSLSQFAKSAAGSAGLCSRCAAGELVNSVHLFFCGQISLFSAEWLLLDEVRLETNRCSSAGFLLLPQKLSLVNLGAFFSFLAEKGNLFSTQLFKSALVSFLPARVLLLALQPCCKCSMCGLYANTVYLRGWYNSMKVSATEIRNRYLAVWLNHLSCFLPADDLRSLIGPALPRAHC